jgi:predicted RNA binding protein YcfA (HicA-like mRNA interferase family)
MKYREASKKLKALGCEELPRRGAGSHRVWHNPKNGKIAPLPDWGSKDL